MVLKPNLVKLLILITTIISSDVNQINTEGNIFTSNPFSSRDVIAGDVFFEIVEPLELQYTYRLKPAKDFGPPFNSISKLENVALVPTVPPNACTFIQNSNEIEGNVALIERGTCSFLSKAIHVEQAGAKAVIVTDHGKPDSNEDDYYIEMIHDNTARDTSIPAGYLLGRNGRIIRIVLNRLKMKYAIINLPVNLTFTPIHKMNPPPWLGL